MKTSARNVEIRASVPFELADWFDGKCKRMEVASRTAGIIALLRDARRREKAAQRVAKSKARGKQIPISGR